MKSLYFIICLCLSDCSTYGLLTSVEGVHQKIIIEDGYEVLYSLQNNLLASTTPSVVESDTSVRAYVQVGNGTNKNFIFSPSNITVIEANGLDFVSNHHVYT